MPTPLWRTGLAALGLATTGAIPSSRPDNPELNAGPRPITILARDYTFEAPDTVAAGPTIFRLENHGRMAHELVIFTAGPGVSAAAILAAPAGEERRSLADPPIGVLFTPLGHPASAELVTSLQSGRWYILFCAMRDTKDMPFHYAIGMVDSIYAR